MSLDSPQKTIHKNLFDYTQEELLVDKILTHYELLNIPEHASSDGVKKAFRKASLKYHPDKLSPDVKEEREYVFLALRQAHDTLMDPAQRQAYDSTVLPFDDKIPPDRTKLVEECLYTDDDFYKVFGPVFDRNLRFDARIRPDAATGTKGNNKKRNKAVKPPSLGDADTAIEQVHEFYDYWINFESWRDFSGQAASELQVEQELENAESRFEKRWIQKEIDKRGKQLKRTEMQRISTLVERARDCDPRLRAERAAQKAAKEQAKLDKIRQEQEAVQEKERQAELERQMEIEKKEQQARDKADREEAKQQLRKARQALRKMASSSFEDTKDRPWDDTYDMEQDVNYLCFNLSRTELEKIHNDISEHTKAETKLKELKSRVEKLRNAPDEKEQEEIRTENVGSNNNNGSSNDTKQKTNGSDKNPWTKEELSALAKAVRKYPPGGASRWDSIALFVNNLCKQDNPRSKEECIEKYNAVAKQKPETTTTSNDTTPDSDNWTPEQDQQLQDGLAKFPANMDKNERWTSIAQCVPGKSKKQCVQRFKIIREALKKK